MDVRVSAVTPTPLGAVDIGKQVQDLVAATPLNSILSPLVGRVLTPAAGQLTDRLGTFINVTVIVINDSSIGDAAPAPLAPVKKAPPKKAATKQQTARKAAKKTTAKRAVKSTKSKR